MRMRGAMAVLLASMAALACAADERYARVPGGPFNSALKYEDLGGRQRVAPLDLMRRPVSNGEFLAFVKANPEWRRDHVASVFADSRYLSHWKSPVAVVDAAQAAQPVTQVSWFAAQAYCEAQGARLPTWSEWEFAAAADETRNDARRDPVWRERILSWYSRPSTTALPRVGLQTANVYGVQDLHGLVWEWTEDYSAMLISGDNRKQGDADKSEYCGAGSLSMNDPENYAVLMRVAMLSSLQGNNTTRNMGFRCAMSVP